MDLPQINVVASYNNQPGKFYSECYSADSITSFNVTNSAGVINWTGLVNFAETALSQATPKIIHQYVSERGVSRAGGAGGDLVAFVNRTYGTAYNDPDKLLQIDGSYSGLTMRVYENMSYDNAPVQSHVPTTALSIANYLTGILGLVTKSKWVNAIGAALGIAQTSSSIIPAHTNIAHYAISVNWYRYVTINGSSYMYNFTEKSCTHHAFENLNKPNTLQIDSSPETWYSHSSSYFNSYSRQTSDAYGVYCQIGQKA